MRRDGEMMNTESEVVGGTEGWESTRGSREAMGASDEAKVVWQYLAGKK